MQHRAGSPRIPAHLNPDFPRLSALAGLTAGALTACRPDRLTFSAQAR